MKSIGLCMIVKDEGMIEIRLAGVTFWRPQILSNRAVHIANSITPPSEVRRPPSRAAPTFLPRVAGNENGRRLSLVMASGALAGWRSGSV